MSARLALKSPSLAKDEIALKISVEVPDALFNRPQLQAKITIPESAVTAPVVDAQVLDNVREILQQQTGLDVSVSLVSPTVEE
jgi:hypothetical protein